MAKDIDTILQELAKELTDNQPKELGKTLGFTPGKISTFIANNYRGPNITTDGNHLMLQEWRQGIDLGKEADALRKALLEANLIQLANKHLPEDGTDSSDSGDVQIDYCEELIQKIAKKIPHGKYHDVSWKLGVPHPQPDNTLEKWKMDYEKAILEVLHLWKNKTPMDSRVNDLRKAMTDVGLKGVMTEVLQGMKK